MTSMPGKVLRMAAASSAGSCSGRPFVGQGCRKMTQVRLIPLELTTVLCVASGFGNSGELAQSADMTQKNAKGNYILGRDFYHIVPVQRKDEDAGDEYTTNEISLDIIRDKFLKPQPPRWVDSIIFPKKIILSVACGGSHLLMVARDPRNRTIPTYTPVASTKMVNWAR
jgi:hypothetical protein